jgi:dTDP-D-glucose 4,6-dehydratase
MSKLRNHIGYEPEYTFESAVEQTYEWFTSQGLDKQREYDFSSEDELVARLS